MTPHRHRFDTFTRSLMCAMALLPAACSQRDPAPSPDAASSSAAPESQTRDTRETLLPSEQEDLASQEVLKASLPAGEMPATYQAWFDKGTLKRITEERQPERGAALAGEYVFYGARLIEYSGASLQSGARIDLRFDTQGALLSATGSAGKPDDAEISAARNRAQLLRSHALARKASRSHGA